MINFYPPEESSENLRFSDVFRGKEVNPRSDSVNIEKQNLNAIP